ncbi:MAG: hypothetical protein AAGI70_12440, partial [Pseudomonadota bacterium]
AAIVAACMTGPQSGSNRPQITAAWHQQRMILLESPPQIASAGVEDLDGARLAARRADPARLAERAEAERVQVDQLAYLIGSAEGQAFLRSPGPRALARGNPAAICPAIGLASLPGGNREEVAAAALGQCLADLGESRPDCGCQVLALDTVVTVPREELAYATGATARLRLGGQDSVLVAEETGPGEILLRSLIGPVAQVTRLEGGQARITFGPDEVYEGQRLREGFRRGRLAERIYAEGPRGRLTLLIGFEPDELAAQAGAWLAWPTP